MREQSSSIPHLFADKSGVDGGANVVGIGRAGGPVHAEHVDILLKYEAGSESERLGLGKLKMEIFFCSRHFVCFFLKLVCSYSMHRADRAVRRAPPA